MPPICGIAKVMSEMSEEDVQALTALLAAPISAKAISLELSAAGFTASYQTVYRHRARTCSCE